MRKPPKSAKTPLDLIRDNASSRKPEQASKLEFHKEIYEKIINSIDEGIHAIDANGKLTIYNSALEKLEGYKASEVLGKHVTEVYKLDWKSSLFLKVLKEKKPILNHHQNYTTTNGRCVDVVVSVFPLYSKDEVVGAVAIVRDFTSFKRMAEKILDLQEELNSKNLSSPDPHLEGHGSSTSAILGNNKRFLESINWAKAAAQTESPVLIYGETGTGKELFAHSIHNDGPRAQGPFLAINCAAIPESLLEGLLFGTAKGAFTGAINRVGLLEQANGGTLFLDEVNSMPLALQAKLLRVLEEKKVRRLGDKEETPIDTRIISSCNVEPTIAIEKGQMRADLFYRLAVVYLAIPPLRERIDDLELLAKHFIQFYNRHLNKNVVGLGEEVLASFLKYPWPGNIRQLKHTIECAMNIVAPTELYIKQYHIPKYLNLFAEASVEDVVSQPAAAPGFTLMAEIKTEERNSIIAVLKKHNGNITKAAAELGITRQNLQYKLKKYKLK